MSRIILVDWRQDFIPALRDILVERTGGDMRGAVVVFPHQRPRRHLVELLCADESLPKPLFLPEALSVNDWITDLRHQLDPSPLRTVNLLDRAGLLYDVVAELRQTEGGLLGELPVERERFFPWGARLAELLEELFRHSRTPRNLLHLSTEVQPMAAALLEHLARIHEAYDARLTERGWTTPGRDARYVAERGEEAARLMDGKTIILAGFYATTGTEDALFRAMWEHAGADVVLHTDPQLATFPDQAHWTCSEHQRWLERWGAIPECRESAAPTAEPELSFVEGFDLHSQLSALEDTLTGAEPRDTAVVIPDTASLMPVLHHLPVKDVNVSMGYPLSHSSVHRLVEIILRLQETSQGPGRYYWREVVALLRHPYLKMLEPGDTAPMRGILRHFEKSIRSGGTFLDPLDWTPEPDAWPEDADQHFKDVQLACLRDVLTACLTRFEHVRDLAGLGGALLGVAAVLVPEDGAGPWHRFPIDAECLFRLVKSTIPDLTDCAISHDPTSRSVLFSILRQLIRRERVPFEAEPLTGLQVLGMLESRLLKFSTVHIVDATDDKLPGAPAYDPLLPDPLRRELNLPDGRHRSLVSAHNFHRLIAGAKSVRIYYQSGSDGAGPLGGKSVRSRFVEELLWQEEKKRGHRIESGAPPLETVSFPVRGIPTAEHAIEKTATIQDALERMLATKSISASRLDAYLRCPVRFFYQVLTPLRPVDEVSEDGDPAELGTLVHGVLQSFLTPYVGTPTDIGALPAKELMDLFSEQLHASAFFSQMPWDMRTALESTGRERLRRFLAGQGMTTILKLEDRFETPFEVDDTSVLINGVFDRVDERDGDVLILDYKTGGMGVPAHGLWTDDDLWDRVTAWDPGDDSPLSHLADRLPSIQLPLYCAIYAKTTGTLPANAAWVELRSQGAENPLFNAKKADDALREAVITDLTPAAVRFLLRHLSACERFEARPGRHCDWCPYGFACPKA